MKTFQQFKEQVNKKTFEPLEKFGRNFAKDAEKFANSKEAKQLEFSVTFSISLLMRFCKKPFASSPFM